MDKTITLLADGQPIATALDALVLRACPDEALWRVTLVWLIPCGDGSSVSLSTADSGCTPFSVEIRDGYIRHRYACCEILEFSLPASAASAAGGVLYTLISFLAHAKEEIS